MSTATAETAPGPEGTIAEAKEHIDAALKAVTSRLAESAGRVPHDVLQRLSQAIPGLTEAHAALTAFQNGWGCEAIYSSGTPKDLRA